MIEGKRFAANWRVGSDYENANATLPLSGQGHSRSITGFSRIIYNVYDSYDEEKHHET